LYVSLSSLGGRNCKIGTLMKEATNSKIDGVQVSVSDWQ